MRSGGMGLRLMLKMSKTKDYNSINWHEIFAEDSSSPTGLRWKISPALNTKAGSVAGSILTNKKSGSQCFQVGYSKTIWYVHRILWVMRNVEIDADLDIDHIDGNALNNSVENLRLVSTTVNMRNQKQYRNNSSGVTGVGFYTTKGYSYAVAYWCNLDGKQEVKKFSFKKLGKELAFQRACEYREKMIAELNETGAGYSDRHGE
jgi:HNH endonuclease/AP2 domain